MDSEKNCDVEHVKKIDQLQEKLLIAEKTYEKLKIKNKQLNDELNSLQIYNHNLEKNYDGQKNIPSYTIWDKFNQYYLLVELWINKVNITLMKKKEEGRNMVVENFEKKVIASKESQESEKKKKYSNFGKSLNSLVVKTIENKTLVEIKDYQIRTNFNQALKVMTSEPIQITDEESAKERITQWVDQKNHSKQVELATKAYKLYHRMSLVYIYNDLHIISVEKHPNDEREQRRFERNFMCTQLGIHTRTERRQKKSAFRIYKLINIGITLDQLVNTGLNISNFEVTDYYYDIFLTDLKLGTIKNLFQNPNMQDNMDLDTEDSESNESNVAN
ncbi:unnamed protein product [Rhizophagus irregularis]|nr:unnamed protein product [Rhizophagus irregularis]